MGDLARLQFALIIAQCADVNLPLARKSSARNWSLPIILPPSELAGHNFWKANAPHRARHENRRIASRGSHGAQPTRWSWIRV